MRFNSEAERKQHCQASLIPQQLWRTYFFFDSQLSEFELEIMNKVDEFALPSLDFQALPDNKKRAIWLAFVFSHPDASDDALMQIAHQLTIKPQSLFLNAIAYGRTSFFEKLISIYSASLEEMIISDNYRAFFLATEMGHLAIVDRLLRIVNERGPHQLQTMITAGGGYGAFCNAAHWGHLAVMKLLVRVLGELEPEQMQSMLVSNNYYVFILAARSGHLSMMKYLITLAPEEKIQAMLTTQYYDAFRFAASNGYLEVIEYLLSLSPDKVQAMLSADNYSSFRKAAENNHGPLAKYLLNFSSVFAYAERHDHEYGITYIYPFVQERLDIIRSHRERLEQESSNMIFDLVEPEEAKLGFYLIRNLIRRNDATLTDEIRFLIEIPALIALAHRAIDGNQTNELLRLALRVGNQAAAELLLALPSVLELAEQHNYYRDEARGAFDLRQLAQDKESSVQALSIVEQKSLQLADKHYGPMIKQAGVPHIMTALRYTLALRYEQKPAQIICDDGSTLVLPLEWQDFQALLLTTKEKNLALQAYYQHTDHTAWRYLLKPNPWMAENASYVYVNPNKTSERWSTFEQYQPLIVMLFLAALDEEIASYGGYTPENRLEHFIAELAYIGRAHNWDESRFKRSTTGNFIIDKNGNRISEECDDLRGDKPSCFSGVKRRLFQSVLGNPLLKILTGDDIKEELRSFVREHFNVIINDGNREILKKAWQAYIDELDKEALDLLKKTLDISITQQEHFLDLMKNKYGEQFTFFQRQVLKAFALDSKDAHASRFEYVGLQQLLQGTTVSGSPSNIGFFAQTPDPINIVESPQSNLTG
jgi:ankyrin repeat protein